MTGRRTLTVAAAAAALTIAAGLGVRPFGHTMGTALSPFVMAWLPRVAPAAALAVPLAFAVALAAPRLLVVPAPWFGPAVFGLALVFGLAVNAIPLGTHGWDVVFDLGPNGSFEAKNEYLPALPALSYGAHFYLDHFAELVPSLPINVGGHPPGPVLVLHWLHIDTAGRLAAACCAATAACAPATAALARAAGLDEPRARTAGLLAALSPGLVLFGMSSLDAVYAAAGVVTALLLLRAPAAGCAALALAAFLSWSLLAIGAFAVLLVWRRDGWRAALRLAVGCGVAVLALNGLLAATTGYDPIGTLRATSTYYDHSLARIRPYAFWWIGSPVAWAVSMSPVIAGGWILAARRGHPAALALAGVIVVAALLGFTKAETERIWLPFVPLACVGAAAVLPARRGVLLALTAQALLVSVLFQTLW